MQNKPKIVGDNNSSTQVIASKINEEHQPRETIGKVGGGTPLYCLYRDVPLDRVWFLASLS